MAGTHQKGSVQPDEPYFGLELHEIVGHILQEIEFIGVANLLKCVSDVRTRKGLPELQNVSRRTHQ